VIKDLKALDGGFDPRDFNSGDFRRVRLAITVHMLHVVIQGLSRLSRLFNNLQISETPIKVC
jgi:hypothetical protein